MARIRTVKPRQFDCSFADCDQQRTKHSSVAGSFCSEECAARHEGRKFLNQVRTDHRFCWSCFRARKEIERPTDEARRNLDPICDQALVGFEYHSEHVEMGPYGLECECGAVDHDVEEWDRRDEAPYHWYLYRVSQQLVAEGQREDAIDLETFADALWETDDLELAVGLALRS